jgi:predicted alpha/beta-hydrolase family hydrolase
LSTDETVRLAIDGGQQVSAIWTEPESSALWTFVYAPGAGASLKDGFGIFAESRLAQEGMAMLRFQFPYAEAGRHVVDRPPVLESTWRAAIAEARGRTSRIVAGGRSMGGRIASQVVAKGEAVDAMALFAYPLHPPGDPAKLRDAHLPQIGVPTLFCSGTKDPFATPEELERAAGLVPEATVHLLTDADHSFRVAKATGRSQRDVWDEAVRILVNWLSTITKR